MFTQYPRTCSAAGLSRMTSAACLSALQPITARDHGSRDPCRPMRCRTCSPCARPPPRSPWPARYAQPRPLRPWRAGGSPAPGHPSPWEQRLVTRDGDLVPGPRTHLHPLHQHAPAVRGLVQAGLHLVGDGLPVRQDVPQVPSPQHVPGMRRNILDICGDLWMISLHLSVVAARSWAEPE